MKKILIALLLFGVFCGNKIFALQEQSSLGQEQSNLEEKNEFHPLRYVGYIGWMSFASLALSKNEFSLALALAGIPCIDRIKFLTGLSDEQQLTITAIWVFALITKPNPNVVYR